MYPYPLKIVDHPVEWSIIFMLVFEIDKNKSKLQCTEECENVFEHVNSYCLSPWCLVCQWQMISLD